MHIELNNKIGTRLNAYLAK